MSRLGKKPIKLPTKVKVLLSPDGVVAVEGPKGTLQWSLPALIKARMEMDELILEREDDSARSRAMHGLARALIFNMVKGVTEGFKRELEIHGVGFKAALQGKILNLSLGYSHPILFEIPDGVKVTVSENTKLTVEGIDNHCVGQCAADIQRYYPPEPYKGKGIRFKNQQIRRKEGKTVQ